MGGGGVCLPGVTGKEVGGAAEAILITFLCDTCDPHASLCAEGGAGVGASQGVCMQGFTAELRQVSVRCLCAFV